MKIALNSKKVKYKKMYVYTGRETTDLKGSDSCRCQVDYLLEPGVNSA